MRPLFSPRRAGFLTIVGAVFALSFAAVAFAGSSSSTSASGSNAGAAARQGQQLNLIQNSSPGVKYGGGYTVHNTPDVIPPAIYTMNKCSAGESGGASVAGFGISFGISHNTRECELQNWFVLAMRLAAFTHNPRYTQWAIGMACAANKTVLAVAPKGTCPSKGSAPVASNDNPPAPAPKPVVKKTMYTAPPVPVHLSTHKLNMWANRCFHGQVRNGATFCAAIGVAESTS